MTARNQDIPQGTTDLLILKVLDLEPMHGWGIAKRIRQISDDVLELNQGSLYPAVHRLERRGWITAKWGVSESGRRAKYYSLSKAGRRQLEQRSHDWARLTSAVNRVLEAT